jgi:hypothetical protein
VPVFNCFAFSTSAIHNAKILGGMVCTMVMVMVMATATMPLNMTLAFDPKAKEYHTFYDHAYSDY